MARLHALPSAVLARILSRLPYESLLRVTRVCRRWRILVASRSKLQVQLFRESYSTEDTQDPVPRSLPPSSIHLHPVLHPYRVQYIIGSLAENTRIIAFHPDAPPSTRLFHCPVAFEFITQPVYTTVEVSVEDLGSFTLAREDGVRVKDLFVALQKSFCNLSSPASGEERCSQGYGCYINYPSFLFAGVSFTDRHPEPPLLFVATERITASKLK